MYGFSQFSWFHWSVLSALRSKLYMDNCEKEKNCILFNIIQEFAILNPLRTATNLVQYSYFRRYEWFVLGYEQFRARYNARVGVDCVVDCILLTCTRWHWVQCGHHSFCMCVKLFWTLKTCGCKCTVKLLAQPARHKTPKKCMHDTRGTVSALPACVCVWAFGLMWTFMVVLGAGA